MPNYAKNADREYKGDPWLRQPEESGKAYEAFTIYLNLDHGQRTIAEAGRRYAEKYGLKPATNQCAQWSRKHRWKERAEAYDNFMTAKEVAVHKRRRVAAATKHADQAAEIQEVLMQPVTELRKRIREQGGTLAVIADLDDVGLMRLAKLFGSDLPAHQRAEREALSSTGDVTPPSGQLQVKGAMVKRILQNKTLRGLTEAMAIETTQVLEVEGVVIEDESAPTD
jgi:hypothetical protein